MLLEAQYPPECFEIIVLWDALVVFGFVSVLCSWRLWLHVQEGARLLISNVFLASSVSMSSAVLLQGWEIKQRQLSLQLGIDWACLPDILKALGLEQVLCLFGPYLSDAVPGTVSS